MDDGWMMDGGGRRAGMLWPEANTRSFVHLFEVTMHNIIHKSTIKTASNVQRPPP
jgi:hypothetical protein